MLLGEANVRLSRRLSIECMLRLDWSDSVLFVVADYFVTLKYYVLIHIRCTNFVNVVNCLPFLAILELLG